VYTTFDNTNYNIYAQFINATDGKTQKLAMFNSGIEVMI